MELSMYNFMPDASTHLKRSAAFASLATSACRVKDGKWYISIPTEECKGFKHKMGRDWLSAHLYASA